MAPKKGSSDLLGGGDDDMEDGGDDSPTFGDVDSEFDEQVLAEIARIERGNLGDDTFGIKQSINRYAEEKLRMDLEENMTLEELNAQVEAGTITNDDVKMIIARRQMHEKEGDATESVKVDAYVAVAAEVSSVGLMLNEHLKAKRDGSMVAWLKRVTGFNQINNMARRERARRSHPAYVHKIPCAYNLVIKHSFIFEPATGFVMILNGITIGLQASLPEGETSDTIEFMEYFFTCFFLIEIVVRVLADGWIWLWSFTNLLDLMLIIVFGVLPLWVLKPLGVESDALRTFQVLRVLRLVRLVRAVRSIQMFQILWRLIQGIMDSYTTLVYTYCIIGSTLYLLSIFGVSWIGKSEYFLDDAFAQDHFGAVPEALLTLFQTATLDNWTPIVRTLVKAAPEKSITVYGIFFTVIMIVTLVLLNLVMASIMNNSFKRQHEDMTKQAEAKQEQIMNEISDLRRIFHAIDTNGDGQLTKEEYDDAVQTNKLIQDKFAILQITRDECQEIWSLLDTGFEALTADQFADGLRALQGEPKAKDSFRVARSTARLNRKLDFLRGRLDSLMAMAAEVRQEAHQTHKELGGVICDVHEFVQSASRCIPHAGAPREQADFDRFEDHIQRKLELAS